MKAFDLEKAKSGKPVCTRCGQSARIVCYDYQPTKDGELLIIAIVDWRTAGESIYEYHLDGTSATNFGSDDYDLCMADIKHEGWVNMFRFDGGAPYVGNGIYPTKEDAEKYAAENSGETKEEYLGAFPFTWQEE